MRLAAELRVDLEAIERRVVTLSSFASAEGHATEEVEHMRTLALAFELERFYTSMETTLTRALEALDGDVPRGPHWHAELLRAASVEIPGFRPALLAPEAATAMRTLLGFRHFARHAYDVEPEAKRVVELAQLAQLVGRAWRASLVELLAMLEA